MATCYPEALFTNCTKGDGGWEQVIVYGRYCVRDQADRAEGVGKQKLGVRLDQKSQVVLSHFQYFSQKTLISLSHFL